MENTVTHIEWVTSKPDSLKTFFKEMFGWEFKRFSGDYLICNIGEDLTIGILNFSEATAGGTPNVYIDVDSIDRCFARARSVGGEIAVRKRDVGEAGCYGFVRAPDGNLIGLHEESREVPSVTE
jgi:predicted enzyme related to lactoylglutathione lyase